jgi:hypothetical protein
MRHVRPDIDEAEALRRWHAPRGGLIRTLFRALAPRKAPQRVELVWLPAYLVRIELDLRGVKSEVICSVDGLSGSFAIFQMESSVVEGESAGESFPAVFDLAQAERVARESLLTTILRRRGRAGKPVPGATRSVEPLLWPYWVYYHRRRGGRMDIQLLDAATGVRPGHKIKLGLLEAFRAAARNQSEFVDEERL